MSIELRARFSTKIDWRTDEQFVLDNFQLNEEDGIVYLEPISDNTELKIATSTLLLDKSKNYKVSWRVKKQNSGDWFIKVGGIQNHTDEGTLVTDGELFTGIYTNLTSNTFEIEGTNYATGLLWDLQIEEIGYTDIEIIEDEVVLTKELQDLREFNDRSGEYSKEFRVPGTSANDKFFKNCYDVSVYNSFNIYKKIKCAIYVNDRVCIDGFLSLNSIEIDGNNHYYVVNVFGGGLSFFNDLKSKTLRDLDYTDINHIFNYTNISNSWYVDGKTAQENGLKYVYPEVDYGQHFDKNKLTKTGMKVGDYRPNLYIKSLFDKIHDYLGYTAIGNFIDSDVYKNMCMTISDMPNNNDQEFSIIGSYAGGMYPPSTIVVENTILPGGGQSDEKFFGILEDFNKIIYPGKNSSSIEDKWEQPTIYNPNIGKAYYKPERPINTKISGIITAQWSKIIYRLGKPYQIVSTDNETFSVVITIYNSSGSVLDTIRMENQECMGQLDTVVNWTSTKEIDVTDKIYFSFKFYQNDTRWLLTNDIRHTITNVGLITDKISEDAVLDFTEMVPNMPLIDFIKSFITMFNLFTVVDNIDKTVTYSTYEDFFTNSESYDWSYKLDRSQPIEFLMSNEFTSRKILLTHQLGSDIYSKKWEDKHKDSVPGYRQIITSNEFEDDEYEIETDFANLFFDEIINNLYLARTQQSDSVEIKLPEDKPLVGFYRSLPIATPIKLLYNNSKSTANLSSAHTFTTWLYPDNSNTTDNIVLNFNNEPDLFSKTKGRPNKNLYTEYWKMFLDNYLSKDARVLRGQFNLSEIDYAKIKLNETIYIDGQIYFINKISDFAPDKLTECELIKKIFNNAISITTDLTNIESIPKDQLVAINGDTNTINNNTTVVIGTDNFVDIDSENILINGDGNTVINCTGLTITGNNEVWVNNELVEKDGIAIGPPDVSMIDTIIDAGKDCVSIPYNPSIGLIDGGENYVSPWNEGAGTVITASVDENLGT